MEKMKKMMKWKKKKWKLKDDHEKKGRDKL
jgi:hypothetical protein